MPPVTAQVPGTGTTTLSYTIPGDGLDVEAVYAAIDATAAGGDVTAELTITDQSGVVIARKTQASTVSAGGTGSATWALRLDDDSGGGGGGGITEIISTDGSVTVTSPFGAIVGLSAFVPPTGNAHYQATTAAIGAGGFADFSWAHVNGGTPLNLGTPTLPKVTASGHYAFSLLCQGSGTVGLGDELKLTLNLTDPTPTDAPLLTFDYAPGVLVNPIMALTTTAYLKVNGTVKGTIISITATGTMTYTGDLWVTRLS